jgi:hypothetical protein
VVAVEGLLMEELDQMDLHKVVIIGDVDKDLENN